MLRNLFAAICVVLLVGATANAAVTFTATLVANPPAVNFTTDTDYNAAPLSGQWESYVLGISTGDASKISAVDITLNGLFNQRWNFNSDTEVFDSTPSSSNAANADSHLNVPATGIVFVPASENNNQPSALLTAADTAARDYGVGTLLRGSWGFAAAEQTSTINFGYIVVPKNRTNSDFDFHIELATNPETDPPLIILDNATGQGAGFCNDGAGPFCQTTSPGENTAPIIGDLGPLVGNMSLNGPGVPTIVSGTPSEVDNQDPTPLAWSLLSSDPGNPGAPVHAPTVDPATGMFSWDVDGSKGGLYKFTYKATDNGLPGAGGPLSDTGLVSVNVIVPEPATMTMIGLALVGCVGLIRRRS